MARRTAEKIDQIESEMIDAPASQPATRPMQRPAQGSVAIPGMAPTSAPTPAPTPAPAAARADRGLEPPRPSAPLPPLEFGTSMVLGDEHGYGGIQVSGSSLPAELEEAAILFANGQSEAAASTLRSAIARGTPEAGGRQAWAMLFDVLQACGSKADFEAAAIDYAARFEKSPPAWVEGEKVPAESKRGPSPTLIAFPARLDASAARQVEMVHKAGAARRPASVDFRPVTEIDNEGAALVVELLRSVEKSGRELRVFGARELLEAARARIEPGRRDEVDICWQAALLALRLLGEKEAFDDLAIDFCVTYEVSPPSWETLPPSIRPAAGPEAAPPAAEEAESRAPASCALEGGTLALRGDIAGRMPEALAMLHRYAVDRRDIVIDCRALRRLDFLAAGELLNEVVVLVSGGKTVLFVEPSAMVDALMTVMGIHELADIRRRKI